MTRRRNHPDRRLVTPQELQDQGKFWFFFGLLTLVVVGVLFTIADLAKVGWGVHLWRRGR